MSSFRAPLFIVAGLAIGITGTILYKESVPPPAGSVEARNAELERELTKTKVALAAAEARPPRPEPTTREKFAAGARTIMEDLKAGRTVDMNEVFRAAKPMLRDFSPLFERIQRRDMFKRNEFRLADLTRKYHLNPAQQEALRAWQKAKTEEQIAAIRAHNESETSTFEDMVKSGNRIRPDDGLDNFMGSTLTGEDLAKFKSDRLNEKVERVQEEADRRVSRLNSMVTLDEQQQDQVFSLMARSSPDFDPGMKFEGLGDDSSQLSPGQSRDEAILQILRPEQREQYDQQRRERQAAAQREFDDLGLKLPDNWDMLGDQ